MGRSLKRFLAGIMALTLGAGLTGCGNSKSAAGAEKVRLMVWSPSEDQSKESGEWLQTMCKKFASEHPEWDITFVYGVADEATATDQVSQDPDASADVFMYANDHLTNLIDAKAIVRFGGKYKEEIESTSSKELLNSLTVNNEIYGVPFTTNTWYMFYDKSVFSDDDVKNLDTMLKKGTVSFPLVNSWYLPAFYLGNGCTLFGNENDESKGVDFGGDKAVDVTNYIIDLASNPNFKIDADGSALAGLRDGSVSAMFTGSWDANAIKEALGDKMGVTSLPTFNINGGQKQMLAYAGSKAIGVNAHSEHMEQAVALAVYLGSEEAQKSHYELRNVIPCNTELLKEPEVAADALVEAQNDTFNNTSVLQPFVAAMSNCWTPVENMGKGIRNKSVTHDNAKEQTEAMNAAMNSNGLN
ncbi:extracellular solute-binding protein [Lachnoanaerobaculum saburreum]|uniref:ABC transporter, solute-binding protein n=1 Tax=Lachnoanaerobaculum saburreum TaxID=467210 RepID=A0A133ZN68_9FIRM|nr:extracellular solute-binding protein [Lachnoanaerobaculum saburreum]KXB56885.1 ABC transporter, solute-binding protein [Lachnoanaerobaculum saburreum]